MNRKAETASPRMARVRNEMRRPCSFRCEGRTIRLGPGEEARVPEPWLGSLELRRLSEAGRLVVEGRARGAGAVPKKKRETAATGSKSKSRASKSRSATKSRAPKRDTTKRRTTKRGTTSRGTTSGAGGSAAPSAEEAAAERTARGEAEPGPASRSRAERASGPEAGGRDASGPAAEGATPGTEE